MFRAIDESARSAAGESALHRFHDRTPARYVAGLLVAAFSISLPASADTGRPALELQPCHLDFVAEWARCGTLEVPEDHDAPDGRRISLRVAVLPALEEPPEPDPIFLLAGGPGQSAIALGASAKATLGESNRRRDVVLVDQRGTGGSAALDCELDLEANAFDDQAKARAVTECLAAWDGDPALYGTLDHVRDLEAVRQALGLRRINLYGGSYGTRVGQVYLREFPASLRAVVLDGVAAMDMRIGLQMGGDAQLVLEEVFERCRQQPACAARFPRLEQRLGELLTELEENPRRLQLPDPATGEPETIVLDHRALALGLRALLYGPSTQRLIPLLIDQAEAGLWTGLVGVTGLFTEGVQKSMTPGLMFAVLCQEDLAGVGTADISQRERESFVGTAQAAEFLGYCAAWPPSRGQLDRTPAAADLPVLLLSGGLDPATPPYLAERVAAGLPNSRHLVVDAGGHTVGAMGCVPELIRRFFEAADAASLDAGCLDEIAYPSFFVSSLGPTP